MSSGDEGGAPAPDEPDSAAPEVGSAASVGALDGAAAAGALGVTKQKDDGSVPETGPDPSVGPD